MASPYGNLQSKLERAIVAYLILKACGTDKDILPFESDRTRSVFIPDSTGLTTISTGIAVPDVQFTGNYRIPVLVSVQGSASVTQGSVNAGAARVAFDGRVAQTGDMLNQTSDGQTLQATAVDITNAGRALAGSADPIARANNADMVDFTAVAWFEKGFGKGEAKDENCTWEIVIMFEVVCCAKNVD